MTHAKDGTALPDLDGPSERDAPRDSLSDVEQPQRPTPVRHPDGDPRHPASTRERDRRASEQVARTLLPPSAQGPRGVGSRRRPSVPAREETDYLLDVNEAAAMLSIAPATLRNWAYQRRIPKVKLGGSRGPLRFRVSDLQRYIRASVQRPLGARVASREVES